ncbi:MAG: hypothetical protein IPM22_01805 [Betaproteobacteria bacterium]|nr:hypothetical protein [Betaproteobacteria bacterium]MCC7216115.1 hypothetical protein [Burkholderiales bacterium]
MRTRSLWHAAAIAALGLTTTAGAAPCYIVVDGNDAVVFRDTQPPFDLSDPKSPERAALRQRGQHLIVAEFDKCYAVGFISPTTGATTSSVDDIVMQLKPAVATSVNRTAGSYRTP